MMTKEEIRSKIKIEIKSEDVTLFVAPPDERQPLAYAVIKADYHRMLPYTTEVHKNIAIRSDQKTDYEWTRESILNGFVDTIFDGISEGRFEPAPIWFRTTEKYAEELKKLTQ